MHVPQITVKHPSPSMRRVVFQRDKATCQYCGETSKVGIDHVVPYALGGPTRVHNLVVACRGCNTRKHRNTWIPRNFEEIGVDHEDWKAEVIERAKVVIPRPKPYSLNPQTFLNPSTRKGRPPIPGKHKYTVTLLKQNVSKLRELGVCLSSFLDSAIKAEIDKTAKS